MNLRNTKKLKVFFAGKYLGTLYIGLKQLIFLRRYLFSTNPFNKVGNTLNKPTTVVSALVNLPIDVNMIMVLMMLCPTLKNTKKIHNDVSTGVKFLPPYPHSNLMTFFINLFVHLVFLQTINHLW